MNRIDEAFKSLGEKKHVALMPYLPAGYPTLEISLPLIQCLADCGADMIELGIPFSDPLADGPVIQHATRIALENGMNVQKCTDMVRQARDLGITIPLLLMGYYNPILRFGVGRFAEAAKDAGADGLIVPDLPPEEAGELYHASYRLGLDLVFLVAPTSTPTRLSKITQASHGFVYLVSVTGITGARDAEPDDLAEFVARVRAMTAKPLCVGFGISNVESARRVAEFADGVIVGSALVSRIGNPDRAIEEARQFILELRAATQKGKTPSRRS